MQLDQSVVELLEKLRKQIRWYVLVEGIAIVVISLGVLFWLSLGIDAFWFSMRRLELPVWIRVAFMVVTAITLTFLVVHFLVGRLLRNLRAKALALVLEKRFPNLDDRLITAVEMADDPQAQNKTLTSAMLGRTARELTSISKQLNLSAVFDSGPIRKAVTIAVVMFISLVAFAATNKPALARWAQGYLMFEEEYWQRETDLTVQVIAQPGDRLREFVDFTYKHPRGDDLTLSVKVKEESKTPSQVVLSYRTQQGLRGTIPMSKLSEQEFQHTMSGVLDDMQVWVTGGDFTNRVPFKIVMVEPPRVDQVTLLAKYPEYTSLNRPDESGRTPEKVLGTSASVPVGTDFLMQAETNKSLIAVQIRSDRLDLDIIREDAVQTSGEPADKNKKVSQLTLKSEIGDPIKTMPLTAEQVKAVLSEDKKVIVPFVMLPDAMEKLAESKSVPWPLPFPADTELRIYLHDTDDVIGSDPTRTTINGIIDQPPEVDTELKGIGTSITRKALIPVAGMISDDYGVAKAEFSYAIDQPKPNWPAAFRRSPAGELEFKLQYEADRPYERFEVLPLNLSEGQTLVLTVTAQDGDSVQGPNVSNGEVFRFQIVSNEELLSLLYQKELNLRRRFEQMIEDIKKTRDDITNHQTQYETTVVNKTDETTAAEIDNTKLAVTSCAERSLYSIRQNATESAAVTEVFRDIRDEMINNGVDSRQMLERINDRILRPFDQINEEQFPLVDEQLGQYKHTNEQGLDPRESMETTVESLDRMIAQMEQILNEMRKLESFHEAIELLKIIIDQQKDLKAKTEEEKKKDLIDDLFN